MITNGKLVILLPKKPLSPIPGDNLNGMRDDSSLRQYFGIRAQTTSDEEALGHAKNRNSHDTIVVVEQGFFATKNERVSFRDKLERLGVPKKHILFGEDYASGYHHILLTIHGLCE